MQSLRRTLDLARTALTEAGIDHALIGGLALGGRGVHRATMDVDLLIDGRQREAALNALLGVGFRLAQASEEVMHFDGVGLLDLLLARREATLRMLQSATMLEPLHVKCVSAEDIIGLKIQAYFNDRTRELQDKADFDALIRQHRGLNWEQIKTYADLFGEWPTIEKIKNAQDV